MLLPFLVNPSAPVPIFQQIADGLRAAIGRGAFPAGSLLPSVRAIAARWHSEMRAHLRAHGLD
ncbi:MAG: GntR family transcriptional regulator [Planctomycetes bacterium]|nr:GntR family transcriptional regulator [Planctomycetota bacterium]